MSNVRELHNEAMKLAQLAMVAHHEGNLEKTTTLAYQAYEYESQAADLIPHHASSEPTRSILYLSAASLAYQCKELHAAQRLVAQGLSGYPPSKTEQDLKNLYEQIEFQLHLQERGEELEDEALQLSLQGKAVGPGMILYSEFISRIEKTRSLIDRTVQRLMHRNYQRAGRVAQIYKPFTQALVIPDQHSFAIAFKLIRTEDHRQMPLFFDAAQVIDEFLTGIEHISKSNEDKLKERIPEQAYYRHFVSMARDVAPDGEKVSLVGFASTKQSVTLTRQRRDIVLPPPESDEKDVKHTPIKVKGLLDYATSRQKDIIGLTTDDSEYNVLVEEGLDDLVRSYFGQYVVIIGTYDGKNIHLTDIYSADDE